MTLAELAAAIGARLRGDGAAEVGRVATLPGADERAVTFLANAKYRKHLAATRAGAVILAENELEHFDGNALICANPYAAFARASALLQPVEEELSGIHPSAVVDASAEFGEGVLVGANCVIEAGVRIGAGSRIGPGSVVQRGSVIGAGTRLVANVTICHGVTIGCRGLIHPGAVIGSDGFGLALEGGRWLKVPQVGGVVIGDDVEIGANTTIDRGALEDTILEEGVKLDNQIQIAHNVVVGAHTAMAGCVGVAGSAKIGKRCQIGGAAVVLGHLEVADDVVITACSLVTKSIATKGVYSSSLPVEPQREWSRMLARLHRLEKLEQRLKALEARIEGSAV